MLFSVTYKGSEYRAKSFDFVSAQNDLENSIGRPLPNGSEIRNETTGDTYVIRWGAAQIGTAIHQAVEERIKTDPEFLARINGTSAEQLNAFDEVLQCDLFVVNV